MASDGEERDIHEDALGFVDKTDDFSDDLEETKDQPAYKTKKNKHNNDEDEFGSGDEDVDNLVRFLRVNQFLVRHRDHDGHIEH
jgi:hypothetical protein